MFTRKELKRLIVPLIIEQLLNSMMGTVDTVMVARAGSAAISAVSLVDSINILAILIFSAMATGGAILASQYLGKGMKDSANHAGAQLLLAVSVLSMAATVLCVVFHRALLRIVFGSVDADVMASAQTYFLITVLSYPLIAIYNAAAALFRSDGNSRLPMTISTASNVINIGGNALLIFGFGLGVAGAAWSTFASRLFCAVMILVFLKKTNQAIGIKSYLKIRPDAPVMIKILKIGVPTGIENGMFQFGKLAIQSTISTMGTAAIAANALTSMLEGLSGQASIGIGLGMMTVVGQCIGAGDDKAAGEYIKRLTFAGWLALVVSSILVSISVQPLTVLSGMEKDVAALAIELTIFVHIIKPITWVFSFLPAYGMRAAGDVRFSMAVSSITMWTCRVAVTIVLARVFGFGPIAMWIGMAADWTLRSLCFIVRFKSGRWLSHRVLN